MLRNEKHFKIYNFYDGRPTEPDFVLFLVNRQAALVIADVLDKHGFETINLAYAAESANINALLLDLKKPDVNVAIATLPGLMDLISGLEAAQQEFETAFLQVVDLKIEKEKLSSATKLRAVIRTQINNELIVYLNGP